MPLCLGGPPADDDAGRSARTGGDGTSSAGPDGTGSTANGRAMNKADLRRAARKQREAEWTAFNATKPDEQYENPSDVAAIEDAERTVGDFKLKSDPDYVIPEVRGRHGWLPFHDFVIL